MNQQHLQSLLSPAWPLCCYNSIDSTNNAAKVWAREGAPHGALVVAERQSAGRGRRGRGFYSPEGGLYMSLIVDSGALLPGQLTTLAAVAVLRAVDEQLGLKLHIKWVNDLLLSGRKVCGILCEGIQQTDKLSRAVIGIGVNLGPLAPPPELAAIVGTLHRPDQPIDREALCASIVKRILEGLPLVPAHMADYRAHCLNIGQRVAFDHQSRALSGIAQRVDDEGALWVDTAEGALRLFAGEVSLRAPAGA